MTKTFRVLFLDDNQFRHEAMDRAPVGQTTHCYTVDGFLDALRTHEPFDMVSLDHDLNDFDSVSLYAGQEATGADAAALACGDPELCAKLPPIMHIHSVNPCGAQNMRSILERHGFTVRWIPFSD